MNCGGCVKDVDETGAVWDLEATENLHLKGEAGHMGAAPDRAPDGSASQKGSCLVRFKRAAAVARSFKSCTMATSTQIDKQRSV